MNRLFQRPAASRAAVSFGGVLVIAAALGCSGGGLSQDVPGAPDDASLVPCVDPRPQICTREYLPVCGEMDDGSVKTFGNGCSACGDPAVIGHRPGEC